ncbi:hypothetical protein MNBD_GAMMA23-452 [hydrothermal vent metagenome]|uniref:Uncharacterized protein n=1 Tax=hydrothermal vent metagenome TaxID=652676 RepID=A0A3B1A668_9ZZZZ
MVVLSKVFQKVFFGFLISIFFASVSYAGNFEKGVKLFKSAKYRQAVKQFRRAEAAGVKKTSLFYNLGVSYFKLSNYSKAKKYFLIANKDAKFSQLAQYNLGLVALKQKKNKQALKWFFRASRDSGNPRITAIANKQIDKLKPGKGMQKFDGGLVVAYGNDSNVLLLNETSPSNKSDSYLENYLYGSARLGHSYRLGGSWYQQNYSDINGSDFNVLKINGSYLFALGNWKIEPGVAFSNSQLGSRDYLDTLDLNVVAKRSLGQDQLTVRYRYSDISAKSSVYNYLEGVRHQARVEYFKSTDVGRLRYRYQLELNDRQDRAAKSYSPTRHDFRLRLRKRLADSWKLKLEAQYRFSNYPSVAGISRKDNRLRAIAGVNYRLNRQWTIASQAIYTDNKSNLSGQAYKRTDWQIAAQLAF